MDSKDVEREAPLGISVLICGGGVAGLTAALECWRHGCDVRVFEASPVSRTSGASFLIGPTALSFLRHWPRLAQRCSEIAYHPLYQINHINGEPRGEPFASGDIISTQRPAGVPPIELGRQSRPRFHAALLQQLKELGIAVEFDKKAVAYEEDLEQGRATVTLKDGSQHSADLIIAADGIGTPSGKLVMGQPVHARSSGVATFLTTFPVEHALADPVVAEHFKLREDGRSVMQFWMSEGNNAFFWRNEHDISINISRPDNGTAKESWSHSVSVDEVLKYTATIPGWPEYADRAIKAGPTGEVIAFKLMWRDPQPKWTSPGGLVMQIGDAAHTFLPTSANGATQAIEDSITLAACLAAAAKDAPGEDRQTRIADATRVANLLRFERVSCLQAFGVYNMKKFMAGAKEADRTGKIPFQLADWIVSHDPENYALEKYGEGRAHLRDGTPFKNSNTPPGLVYRPWSIDTLVEAHMKGEPTVLDGGWN